MLVTLTGLRVKPNRALFHTIDMHTLLVRYRHSKQMRKYIYDFKTGSSPISTPNLQGVKGKYPLPPPPFILRSKLWTGKYLQNGVCFAMAQITHQQLYDALQAPKSVVGIDAKVFIHLISFIRIRFLRIETKKITEGYITGNSSDRNTRLLLIWENYHNNALESSFQFCFQVVYPVFIKN